mgnify:FL=1
MNLPRIVLAALAASWLACAAPADETLDDAQNLDLEASILDLAQIRLEPDPDPTGVFRIRPFLLTVRAYSEASGPSLEEGVENWIGPIEVRADLVRARMNGQPATVEVFSQHPAVNSGPYFSAEQSEYLTDLRMFSSDQPLLFEVKWTPTLNGQDGPPIYRLYCVRD